MSSDSILSGSAPAVLSKDFGKKKRTNRLAKLKQCKLDARREQWLSQVKSNKVFKDESNVVVVGGGGGSSSSSPLLSSLHSIDERNGDDDQQQRLSKNLETRSRGEENDGSSSLHDSDLEFLISSPNNNNNNNSSRKGGGCCGSGSSISSSSSSNSSDCCSGTVSDEEEDDDGCLDDWEAVADALTVDEERNNLNSEMVNSVVGSGPLESANKACGVGILKQEWEDNGHGRGVVENCRAWRPDDVSRPQSLPNLSKQYSFPMNSERRCGSGREGIAWGCHNIIISQPISCPICYEDLDLTDSSFMPCLCGFRLCLFCHKRILEADGRCPGCRKQYDSSENGRDGGAPRYRFARSFSMGTGS